ncbi:ligand-binding sensor domain-containing protein [Arundinibacter roseus]|uniref:Histidine kinase n=1 Tax=Arundinibacter roseus TaxID=2070510 RepID=A0A4R4K7F9_9BACT|nr:sensor histidine kinase [Arundinibacter roseus]TDB63420.1 histidine kinase [Arundinibacter roseus]
MIQSKNIKLTYLLAFVALLAPGLWAQPMQIQHLTVKDGLSQSSPYHMLKDSRGFLWLGTQDGVNRFDGHHFRVYKPDARNPYSLKGVNIAGIVEDKSGNIWVGSEEGLNCYERSKDRFFLIKTSPHKRRTSPFYATKEELWFTSEGEGIMTYNFKTRKLRQLGKYAYINRDFDYVDWTTYTTFGDVWLQYAKGLVRFDIQEKTYHYYFTDHLRNEYGEPFNVYSFVIDKNNIAWLGTDRGLVRFDHQAQKHQIFDATHPQQPDKLGDVFSLAEDHNEQLWIGTQRNGLWIFDKKSQKFREVNHRINSPESFENYEFYRVYVDNSGIIWANSDPDGLVKIVPNASMFGYFGQPDPTRPERNLSDLSIRSIGEDAEGRIWLGTEGGLDIFNRQKESIEARYFTDEHNILKFIFRDSRKLMWIGTYGGLLLFDPKTKDFKRFLYNQDPGTRIYTRNIVELPDHRLLLGTQLGMWIFDPKDASYIRVPYLTDQNIFSTFIDHQGILWLGSYFDRLYAYKIQGDTWEKIYEGLTNFNINAIREDQARGLLWICTEKGLVAFHRNSRKYKLYDEADGLVNSYIYGVVIGKDGNVFMSTNHGISSLNSTTGLIRNFDLTDGLQGYEYNGNAFFQTRSGECYFGGVKGVNYFYPRQFQTLSYQPRIHFFNFRVNEEPFQSTGYVDEMNLITLNHNQSTFSLEFTSIDYYSNGKNYYKYFLEGQDQGWVNAGDRTYVRYANLSPGNYVFTVKSANRDGVWNDRGRKLYITIRPPFWRTWWFSALYLLGIAGGTFVVAQGRLRRISKKQKERLKIILDAQEQERKSIAQDLHDEVGSRLATLKLYISSLTNYLKESPEADRLKKEVFDIIHISLVDIRRLLRELSPRTLEQYGYAAAVEELVSKINAAEQIHVTFECRKLPEQLPESIEIGLYRITQELLNNSLKHSEASEITISVIPSGDSISFFYSDNGKGFVYSNASKGLGIHNIESRVSILGGKIQWFSAPGKGLEVPIEIPNNG